MKDKSSGSTTDIGGVLLLIFVVLKLTDNIDWSWWWVLSPIWVTVALVLVIFTALKAIE